LSSAGPPPSCWPPTSTPPRPTVGRGADDGTEAQHPAERLPPPVVRPSRPAAAPPDRLDRPPDGRRSGQRRCRTRRTVGDRPPRRSAAGRRRTRRGLVLRRGRGDRRHRHGLGHVDRGWALAHIAMPVVAGLRTEVVDSALSLESQRIEVTGTGDLVSRVADDSRKISEAAAQVLPLVVESLLVVIVSAAGLAAIDWRLGIVGLAALPMDW